MYYARRKLAGLADSLTVKSGDGGITPKLPMLPGMIIGVHGPQTPVAIQPWTVQVTKAGPEAVPLTPPMPSPFVTTPTDTFEASERDRIAAENRRKLEDNARAEDAQRGALRRVLEREKDAGDQEAAASDNAQKKKEVLREAGSAAVDAKRKAEEAVKNYVRSKFDPQNENMRQGIDDAVQGRPFKTVLDPTTGKVDKNASAQKWDAYQAAKGVRQELFQELEARFPQMGSATKWARDNPADFRTALENKISQKVSDVLRNSPVEQDKLRRIASDTYNGHMEKWIKDRVEQGDIAPQQQDTLARAIAGQAKTDKVAVHKAVLEDEQMKGLGQYSPTQVGVGAPVIGSAPSTPVYTTGQKIEAQQQWASAIASRPVFTGSCPPGQSQYKGHCVATALVQKLQDIGEGSAVEPFRMIMGREVPVQAKYSDIMTQFAKRALAREYGIPSDSAGGQQVTGDAIDQGATAELTASIKGGQAASPYPPEIIPGGPVQPYEEIFRRPSGAPEEAEAIEAMAGMNRFMY
jgi:hypothetical protein